MTIKFAVNLSLLKFCLISCIFMIKISSVNQSVCLKELIIMQYHLMDNVNYVDAQPKPRLKIVDMRSKTNQFERIIMTDY